MHAPREDSAIEDGTKHSKREAAMTDPTSDRKTTVEEGTHFKGSLSSKCPIEVKGRIEGDVTAPSLVVSSTGAVHGRVKVGEMRSQGELAGEFDANVVQLSGTVKDNTIVRAKSLEVKLTSTEGMQVVFGECSLEVGADPVHPEAVVRPSESLPKTTTTGGATSARPPADANGA
jgi:cytoskeletal protein CcmA (bactofilin family)